MGLLLLVLISSIDYLSGSEISFSIFYLLPIGLTAWYAGKRDGLFLSLVGATCWLIADRLWAVPYAHFFTPYWNAAVRLGFFMITVSLLSILKQRSLELEMKIRERTLLLTQEIDEHKRLETERTHLIAELEGALSRVKQLRGLLPICASCKRIRDDQGYWNQIEEYVRRHSEAEFTHGICPECAKTLYPQLRRTPD